MHNQYINDAIAALVSDLQDVITRNKLLAEDRTVTEAFTGFKRACTITPSIVRYIADKIARASNLPCFSAKHLEILMLGVIARASSTYGTIPNVVAHLALVGEHADAAILNENAKNETGDREHAPHATLLFGCFEVIGESLPVQYLRPASYHILRNILIHRHKTDSEALQDLESVSEMLLREDTYVPVYNENDIKVALHYSNLCKSDVTDLHSFIVQVESRMDDRAAAGSAGNPYDKRWLAARRLELALREASSVDEHETGRLSYIGAWGQVVESVISQIKPSKYDQVRAWTKAHNDESAGQAVGWSGAAEDGHAIDARLQAVQMMASLKPATFATVLNEVAVLQTKRLEFWDNIVQDLASLDAANEETMISA